MQQQHGACGTKTVAIAVPAPVTAGAAGGEDNDAAAVVAAVQAVVAAVLAVLAVVAVCGVAIVQQLRSNSNLTARALIFQVLSVAV
jgi:hypothetical protein